MRALAILLLLASPVAAQSPERAPERGVVDASEPLAVSVTVYRDPNRSVGEELNRDYPQGFAVISETRSVTLPPGASRIRFEGVSEGMVGITAIVTGLPGGTIEQNRNAALLSPAALVDGTLGNRVMITRTNPATGVTESERAVVRTRADGGLVLQTDSGFEAVRCSGLPERLSFDRVPAGLSAEPVFSIDTRSPGGGTYQVTLTYLSWGFDWQANYVATLDDPLAERGARDGSLEMKLLSWLTLVNDNGQSFTDASLQVVAGTLNIDSDYEDLADPPESEPLRLICYPLGSTAEGSEVPYFEQGYAPMVAPPPPAPAMMAGEAIIVTGSRVVRFDEAAIAVTAVEEQLGDLKLYRVPEPITVAAKSAKQVAFLNAPDVEGRFVYRVECGYDGSFEAIEDQFEPARVLLAFDNEASEGLGRALPQGGLALFEPSRFGELLVAEQSLRDYAVGQDVELELLDSSTVFAACGYSGDDEPEDDRFVPIRATVTNANPEPAIVRLDLGWASEWVVRGIGDTRIKDGKRIAEVTVPGNSRRTVDWRVKPALVEE